MMGFFDKLMGKKTAKKVDLIYSPLIGTAVTLGEVNDPVFAEEMMGKGAAIIPTKGEVYAPCDGEVITVFRTLHAVTIKGDAGADVIIHVGIETVGLNGEHFTAHVIDGQLVKKGDLLLTFDLEAIEAAGYDMITPVVVINSAEYGAIEKTNKKDVSNKDVLIELT